MRIASFDYTYPPELVAQRPLPERDASRMLVLDRALGTLANRWVRDLPSLLRHGDVLVINTSRVIPARLIGRRESGGNVEVLITTPYSYPPDPLGRGEGGGGDFWCLATRTNRLRIGTRITFDADLAGVVQERQGDRLRIAFNANGNLLALVHRIGLPPLPPYIDRSEGPEPADRERYQTIYADAPGSAAAPTAGFHFTEPLLETIRARGVIIAPLALHVSTDTFAPVRVDRIADHPMHGELYQIPAETMAAVAAAKREGRRVIAVGTTTVRALESAYSRAGSPQQGLGWGSRPKAGGEGRSPLPRFETCEGEPGPAGTLGTTRLFIHPGYRFRSVDAVLTNFHQPRSTLLMLVAAFAGIETIQRAYAEAIRERYRLFSYGDAMCII